MQELPVPLPWRLSWLPTECKILQLHLPGIIVIFKIVGRMPKQKVDFLLLCDPELRCEAKRFASQQAKHEPESTHSNAEATTNGKACNSTSAEPNDDSAHWSNGDFSRISADRQGRHEYQEDGDQATRAAWYQKPYGWSSFAWPATTQEGDVVRSTNSNSAFISWWQKCDHNSNGKNTERDRKSVV